MVRRAIIQMKFMGANRVERISRLGKVRDNEGWPIG